MILTCHDPSVLCLKIWTVPTKWELLDENSIIQLNKVQLAIS